MDSKNVILASKAKVLANRFHELANRFPLLRMVSARRPKSFDDIPYELNVWEGELVGTHPIVEGRYAPQHAFSEPANVEENGITKLRTPTLSFPYWHFDQNDDGWKHGIWALWLHRDFGREPGGQADVVNPAEQLACLEAYLLALESAAEFGREVSDLFNWPTWVFDHCDNSCRFNIPQASTHVLTWLVLLLGFSPTRRHSRFSDNKHCTVQVGNRNFRERITLDVVNDVGWDSFELLSLIERDLMHGRLSTPENASDWSKKVSSNDVVAVDQDETSLPDWLPHTLDPTPGDLSELRKRLGELADAMAIYERDLVGKPMSIICNTRTWESKAFLRLWLALDLVADWSYEEDCLNEFSTSLPLKWIGWPPPFMPELGWWHTVPGIYHEIVSNLKQAGFPFVPFAWKQSLEFADCPGLHFNRPWPFEWRGLEVECKSSTKSQILPAGILFASLQPKNSPTIEAFRRDGIDTTLVDWLNEQTYQIDSSLDSLAWFKASHNRCFRIDLSRIAHYGNYNRHQPVEDYYPDELIKSNPFQAASELEGLTGVRLANEGDPVWLLMQHRQFKTAREAFGEQSSFAEYLLRKHPERLFDPDDPNGVKRRDREDLESQLFQDEMNELTNGEDSADLDDRELRPKQKSTRRDEEEVVYLVDRKEIGLAFGNTAAGTVHTWVSSDWFPAKHTSIPERWRSDEVSKAMRERPRITKKQTKFWSEVCSKTSILFE